MAFKHSLSAKGMKPLDEKELGSYESLMQQMINYPDSPRIFSEFYNESLKLLEERGKRKFGIIFRRFYNYSNPKKEVRLHLRYRKGTSKDNLTVNIFKEGKNLELSMQRERGNLTLKEFESHDMVEKFVHGLTLEKLAKGLCTYQPHSLILKDDSSQAVFKY